MSREKHGHICSSFQEALLEEKMGELVSSALRRTYAGESSPVKKISQRTGIAPDSIKRWYTSKKAPNLGHFLILMKTYPVIFEIFLKVSGHEYLIAYMRLRTEENTKDPDSQSVSEGGIANVPINIINVPTNSLNVRQDWFLSFLQHMNKGRAEHIMTKFGVSLKTARRDIERLKEARKIHFVGARKTGRYEIIER